MNPEEVLFALFTRLREVWLSEYGTSFTIRATALDIALRVRGLRPSTPDTPTFVLTVRPTGYGFQVRHRQSGMNAAAPEQFLVDFDEPGVLDRLFGAVMEFIGAERKRLMEYRQSGKGSP